MEKISLQKKDSALNYIIVFIALLKRQVNTTSKNAEGLPEAQPASHKKAVLLTLKLPYARLAEKKVVYIYKHPMYELIRC